MTTRSLIATCVVLLLLPACQSTGSAPRPPFRTVLLVTPEPVIVGSKDANETRKIVGRALVGRGWSITKDEPGELRAKLLVRSHMADILIKYDAEEVEISYLDSSNLKYWKSPVNDEYIHQNYIKWVEILRRDIAVSSSFAE